MISSHQTTTETIAATQPSVKSFIYELSQKNIGKKFTEKNSGTNRRILLKSGLPKSLGIATTAIPLSKNLSKISQSNGFVDSSEPIVHTITDNNCNREEIDLIACDSDKTPTNGDHNFNYDNLLNNNYDFNEDDEDDNIQNVLDKTSELINNLLSGNNDRHLSSLDIHEGTKNSVVIDVDSANNSEVKTVNNEEIIMTSSKGKNRHKYQLHMDSESEEERPCEVVNTNLKLTKSLDNVAESDFKPTSSPKLSYSRAKLISTQQLTSPTQSPNLGEKKLGETSSLSDGKLNASPSTKHRPLSAASISSSSSSTSTASSNNSFGAEQSINGKLIGGMTYMASIESLADQSENEVNPSLTMCERAALEIIDSEKSFVADLGQIIRGYLQDWKERACLKIDELNVLFSNIQEIYEFNSSLLENLIESQADPLKISKCFIEAHERFDVYTTYCTSYPDAISLLTSLLQASHTNSLLASTQKMLKHTLPLGSYLLKPVQRILKYHLLLDSLRKHCDIPEVKEAHEMMKDVARNIDQVKRKLEQKNRVKELSGILDGWLGPDLTVLGELRQEGLLMEHNKPRIVFLFETMLIITKPKEDKRLQFKIYIPCKTLMLVEHLPGDPTSFHVLPFSDPRSQIKLTAKNRDQKRLWAQHIKQAMLQHFDIPNRAKELVFKLGDEEDRPTDKHIWKWPHSSTPEYLERRHQYRRSEFRYRSKKAKKNINSTSLDRGRIKERRESFISYSREELFDKERFKKCECGETCECGIIKKEMSDTLKKKTTRSKSESRAAESLEIQPQDVNIDQEQQPLSPVEIKMYNSKTLPKRIEKIKKIRARKETARFYTDLGMSNDNSNEQNNDNELKIVEPTDEVRKVEVEKKIQRQERVDKEIQKSPKKDSDIIRSILEKSELGNNRKFIKTTATLRRKSLEQMEKSPLSHRKLSEALASINIEKSEEKDDKRAQQKAPEIPLEEPLYESLLRNVHVPYKFAPPMLKRSMSSSSSSSLKDRQSTDSQNTVIYNLIATNEEVKDDESDCDYVTLTYSNDRLETVDGEIVNRSFLSSAQSNDLMTASDTNVSYDKQNSMAQLNSSGASSDDIKEQSFTSSIVDLEKGENFGQRSKSFIHKFMGMKQHDDDLTSQKSVTACSITSRKSFDGGLSFSLKNILHKASTADITQSTSTPRIYRQGSEDLGNRIAHVDYADPRTLFPSTVNVLVNKNSLHHRDSVFSSSSDSVCDAQRQLNQSSTDPFSDSYYEDTAESLLENDFRDSAIYSDDSNERRNETCLSTEEHIYATISRPQSKLVPPKIPKKPILKVKTSIPVPKSSTSTQSPPPVPAKPSNLKSPEVRNSILHVRKLNSPGQKSFINSQENLSQSKSWVQQQVQKYE